MSAAAILLAPWRASPTWTRWYVVALLAAAALAAVLVGVFMQRPTWPMVAAGVLAFAGFFMGMFMLAPGLLLAIDARQLRVPGLQRTAVIGMALLSVAVVALPAAVLGLVGGHVTDIACLLAMALCGGVLMGLMPRAIAACMGLMPMAFHTVGAGLDLPGPGHPGFLPLAAGAVAIMLALAALCWWRQLRADDPYAQGWWQPMVLQFRRASRASGWTGLSNGLPDSTQLLRQQPTWLSPSVNLGPSGPQHPLHSLRVALGGMFVPMTAAGRLRQLAVTLLPGTLVMAMLLVQAARRHRGFRWAWLADWTVMFGWLGGFISLLAAVLAAMQLGQRWQKSNAELPLLAMLPGLGTPPRVRRNLLAASLLPGMSLQLVVLTVLSILALRTHPDWIAAAAMLLTQLTSIGVLVAFTLAIMGGHPPSGWASGTFCAACLIVTSLSLPLTMVEPDTALAHGGLLATLAVAWALLLLVLAWIGRRGWRGFVERPHPFMANEG